MEHCEHGHWYKPNTYQCPSGHDYTPDNTKINAAGHRVCRTCVQAHADHRLSKRQEEYLLALMANDPPPATTWHVERKLFQVGWVEMCGPHPMLTESGRLRVVELLAGG